ncbi:hypothetical protein [Sporosarcina limicola]|uniref:Uncharacterized protein n=1 Tax=Sporosarcina limicola TaxID=34101 RepID=A0A927ML84_9BACL|nr:hypothetical protein [Sporosarcina limicola]MBE1556003.1 hypothetical protein [Sporosarcina limicola]
MGGREGARGYLFQAVVAVLSSLTESTWEKVTLEPSESHEKVDILWEYSNGDRKVTQVKSSINNFSEKIISDLLKELIKDEPSAETYELILVGQLSQGGKKFKRQLDNSIFSVDSEFQKYSGRINIEIEDFSIHSLESKIYIELEKILFSINPLLSPEIKRLKVQALIYQFISYSTKGKTFSRKDLLGWFPNQESLNLSGVDSKTLNLYAFSQIERFFEVPIKEQLKIILQLEKVMGILVQRTRKERDINPYDLLYENNYFSFVKIDDSQTVNFTTKLNENTIFIPKGVNCISELILAMFKLLDYENKKDKEVMIEEFNNRYSKSDIVCEMICGNNVRAFLKKEWINLPLQEVW